MNLSEFKSNFNNGVRPNLYRMEISGIPEKLRFVCKTAQIPGKTIGTIEVPFLNMKHKIAGDVQFDPLSLTVMMDTDFQVRNGIESWMETIKNNDAAYGDESGIYERTGNLIVLGLNGDEIAEYEFQGLWPTMLSPVELGFESNDQIAEYQVELIYSWWSRLR